MYMHVHVYIQIRVCSTHRVYVCNDTPTYTYVCGMLRGRLQRKSSAHIRDVCTLHSMLHCG